MMGRREVAIDVVEIETTVTVDLRREEWESDTLARLLDSVSSPVSGWVIDSRTEDEVRVRFFGWWDEVARVVEWLRRTRDGDRGVATAEIRTDRYVDAHQVEPPADREGAWIFESADYRFRHTGTYGDAVRVLSEDPFFATLGPWELTP